MMYFLSFALLIKIKKKALKKNENNKTDNAETQSELSKLAILEKELNVAEQKQNSETSNSYCFS